ncbi:PH domain containing protein [Panicum miliaceum]|uniref:PH domain containing protein n=1 Tax=Panicum miliaceum TaxID=4540 RepID=A0A3L6TUC3_PANMI|nr:PH domain containing protein [Panicum miliaceum]
MATNGSSPRVRDTESSLEKVKRQLSSGSGRYLLQGPLLKRSETLRKWNERWVILDPTSGKMEYKYGTLPVSQLRMPNIGTPQKKDYFLCAETPGAAKAWVSTLHATRLVLRAHKEAVNSLAGNGSPATLGTVATAVANANATAMEATKEIEAAMKVSMRAALGLGTNNSNEGQLDDLTIMKKEKEELLALVGVLQSQVQREQSSTKQVCEERSESCSGADNSPPFTKHVDASDDDVDKACVSDSRSVLVSSESTEVQLAVDGVDIRPIGDAEWGSFQQSEALIADVREVSPEAEGGSLDIPVVNPPPVNDHMQGGATHP